MITGVGRDKMRALWPHVEGYFRSFERRGDGEYPIGELLNDIMQGKRQCWVSVDGERVNACALTTVLSDPKKTVVIGFVAGDDRKKWRDELVETIRKWAVSLGSQKLRVTPRFGWERELRPLGFRKTHVVMEMNLAQHEG